jgi:hypothetical protein
VVATFEDFYAATARLDLPAVRALLCAPERRALEGVSDLVVASRLGVRVVVRDVALFDRGPAAARVVVTDALGQRETVQLRADMNAPRGWCVAGPTTLPGAP